MINFIWHEFDVKSTVLNVSFYPTVKFYLYTTTFNLICSVYLERESELLIVIIYHCVKSELNDLLLRKSLARKAACVRFSYIYMHRTCYNGLATITEAAVCTILRSKIKCQLTLRLSRLWKQTDIAIMLFIFTAQLHQYQKIIGIYSVITSFKVVLGFIFI